MESPRDPFGAAVGAIRERIRSGRLVQGEQLIASEFARDLRLSATPVREALARLAGEELIEDRRGAGYFAWRLDAVDLIELYDLQADYLRAAILRLESGRGGFGADPAGRATSGDDSVVQMEERLSRLIQRGRSVVLLRAHLLLADRLAPARRAEATVLPPSEEWALLDQALQSNDLEALQRWAGRYSQLRRASAADLVAAMRSAAAG